MENYVVTSGETFADIDAFVCIIAYTELLRLEGKNAEPVIPGILNNSVTPTIRSWNIPFSKSPSFDSYKTVIQDVSEPSFIAKCAPLDSIVEIYDHRFGFEESWKRLGDNCHIEPVGACATLIWEQFKQRGAANKISALSANLLLIGIVSNTLDFGAHVTTERDVIAAKELQDKSNLPEDWKTRYFAEQEATAFEKPIDAILNDTKAIDLPGMEFPVVMGQLELWDAKAFLRRCENEIESALSSFKLSDWFMSIPSIGEKRNYIYTKSDRVKKLLAKIIDADFKGNVGVTSELWLRKEVRKKLIQLAQK